MASRLTAAAKVARDQRIVADRARGLSWATISRRHKISERQAREVVRCYRATEPAIDCGHPLEVLRETLDQFDSVIEEFALAADDATHGSVRVGALKGKLAAIELRLGLLRQLGAFPTDLGVIRHDLDFDRVGHALMDVLDAHDLPDELFDELERILRDGRPLTGAPILV